MDSDTFQALKELASKAKEIVSQDERQAEDYDPFGTETDSADVELSIKAWDLLKELALYGD